MSLRQLLDRRVGILNDLVPLLFQQFTGDGVELGGDEYVSHGVSVLRKWGWIMG